MQHELTTLLARLPKAAAERARAYLPVRPRPAILLYHRVSTETFDPWGLAVSPDRFAAQLAWLSRNRRVMPLSELAQRHREGRLTPDSLAITFDDGYACNAETAAPLLERLGIPATIFLPVDCIEQRKQFWWEELRYIILDTDLSMVLLDSEEILLGPRARSDRYWPAGSPPRTSRQHAFWHIWSLFRQMTPQWREAAMENLYQQCGTPAGVPQTCRPMTAVEVRSIRSPAIEFGSHTIGHASLTALGYDEKTREIRESVDRCEAITDIRPRSIAYPFGDFDDESERIAEDAGYDCACTTEPMAIDGKTRPFALPRITIGDWSPARLRRALAAA